MTRESNRAEISAIVDAFQQGDAHKRRDVLSRAIGIGLVGADTTDANFPSRLARNESGGEETTTKLRQLSHG